MPGPVQSGSQQMSKRVASVALDGLSYEKIAGAREAA